MAPDVTHHIIQELLSEQLERPLTSLSLVPVGGGSINDTYQVIISQSEHFFCKVNSTANFPSLFLKEKNGLDKLAAQDVLDVPAIVACGQSRGLQVLILEWVQKGTPSKDFWATFGEGLARLHRITAGYFGYSEDNYMGALPQSNHPTGQWTTFFVQERLSPQIKLAVEKGLLGQKQVHQFERLFRQLPSIFSQEEPPALLHGDLWSGNFLCNNKDRPVIFDPAIYFGNRHMDLAMTTLFGGFDPLFYASYHHHYPLPGNHRAIWDVCNLYPLLIHLNLFGQGYLPDILRTLRCY